MDCTSQCYQTRTDPVGWTEKSLTRTPDRAGPSIRSEMHRTRIDPRLPCLLPPPVLCVAVFLRATSPLCRLLPLRRLPLPRRRLNELHRSPYSSPSSK
ncbi:hypothetical protein PIB30_082105, partial [Stylosanthes scabra]|nr:hypothetical protein [Stylosanthes scabra]